MPKIDLGKLLDEELAKRIESGKASASDLEVARKRARDLEKGIDPGKGVLPDAEAERYAEELGLDKPGVTNLPPLPGAEDAPGRENQTLSI